MSRWLAEYRRACAPSAHANSANSAERPPARTAAPVTLDPSALSAQTAGGSRAGKLRPEAVARGPSLPPPLILRDGRRLWRIVSGRDGRPTDAAAALVAEAKAARVVTVADNAVLSIGAPASYRGDLPGRLAAQRADVLAFLHGQSDERMAAAMHGDARGQESDTGKGTA